MARPGLLRVCSGSRGRGQRWGPRLSCGRRRAMCAALPAQPGSAPTPTSASLSRPPQSFTFQFPESPARPRPSSPADSPRNGVSPLSGSRGKGKRREGEGKRKGRETHRTTTCPAAARPVSVSFPGSAGRRQARLCPPGPARLSARVSRGFRLGAMATLESLGLVGTIAEGDVVPVDSESGDSEDEEVGRAGGSGGPGRCGAGGRAAVLYTVLYTAVPAGAAPGSRPQAAGTLPRGLQPRLRVRGGGGRRGGCLDGGAAAAPRQGEA